MKIKWCGSFCKDLFSVSEGLFTLSLICFLFFIFALFAVVMTDEYNLLLRTSELNNVARSISGSQFFLEIIGCYLF